MKTKILTSSICLLICISMQAQKKRKLIGNNKTTEITRTMEPIEGVILNGSFDVDIIDGPENEIHLQGESNVLPFIKTTVRNGKLHIDWSERFTKIKTNHSIIISVPNKHLKKLTLSGSGDIRCKSTINTERLVTEISGSGDMDLDVNSPKIQSKTTGSGDFQIKGTSEKVTITISGSGNFDGANLESNEAIIYITGSGDVTVTAKQTLDAMISGSGNINYSGNPSQKDINTTGSGEVKRM